MDIRVWEHPNDLECIRCGRCRAVCPKGAITTSIETAGSKVLGRFTVDLSAPASSPASPVRSGIKTVVGVLGALANVGLILYALLCMLLDLNSQTSGGGITWIALLKNSMFWILWFTGMAVSLVASVRLALASARSDKLQSSQMAAEALMLQICASVLLAAGLGLWWLRYAYAAMLIIPWLTRVQLVLMPVFILICCRDVRAVREEGR